MTLSLVSRDSGSQTGRSPNPLVGRTFTAADGTTRPLRHRDVMVVAPSNALEVRCRSVEQMRLVNALCRLVEVASPSGLSS